MGDKKSEVLQGTLDLMVLKTLYAMGPLHGFGIARRIEQVSDGVLDLNEGTVYTALLRLQQQGWIDSKWGTSAVRTLLTPSPISPQPLRPGGTYSAISQRPNLERSVILSSDLNAVQPKGEGSWN
jgi:hypothetical protein